MAIIDTNVNVTSHLGQIVSGKVTAIGRYYSSSPSKTLGLAEAKAISAAGLDIFVVFEDGAHPVLTRSNGTAHAKLALKQAQVVGQPGGSAIYFALDSALGAGDLPGVVDYFSGIGAEVAGKFAVGVYGDGVVCRSLLEKGLCQFTWLSASRGFPGSKAFFESRRWSLAQDPHINQAKFGIHVDFNEAADDFGAFRLQPQRAMAGRAAASARPMPWLDWMHGNVGQVQMTGTKPTPFTIRIFRHTTYPPLKNVTPESCAATVCAALEETGYRSTRSAAAASYIGYGEPCELQPGCICVYEWPGGQHHVDFCDQIIDDETVRGIGGNQGHMLQDADYPRSAIVATRWPVRSGHQQQTPQQIEARGMYVMRNSEQEVYRALEQIAHIAERVSRHGHSHGDAEPDHSADPDLGCTLRQLPERLLVDAARTATRINPANGLNVAAMASLGPNDGIIEPQHIAVLTAKYWGTNQRRLTVSFMESTPSDLQARIILHLNAWNCGVTFVATRGTGQVRISRGGGGYWSYLGTDILHIPTSRQTMNLENFTMATLEGEFKRVIRHECGHTLGFPHEHMRRELIARIDPQKAYDYFWRTQHWDRRMVDAQVLTPLDQSSIIGTPPDQDSIMCYQLPGSITRDGQAIRGGLNINATDASFCTRLYPRSPTSGHALRNGPDCDHDVAAAAMSGIGDWDPGEDVTPDLGLS